MTSSKNYLIRSVSFFVIVSAIFLFSPKVVFAATVSAPTNVPSEAQIGQEFSVNSELSGVQSGEVYFVKCRLGPSASNLSEGQTYNPTSDVWLFDSGSGGKWVDMPTVEVSGSTAAFSLKCRVNSGVETGEKIIFARACFKQADGSCGGSFQSSSGTLFMALAESTPTPSPQPTPTPTPTPTPIPAKATYQINEANEENGTVLSSVKVYVDGLYTHHYAPEILEFCVGCYCDKDKQVSCGFGQHTVKLERSGFQDWSQMLTINAGETQEVNPVMKKLASTGSPTASPTAKPGATPLGPTSVLGATNPSLPLNRLLDTSRPTTAAGFFPLVTDEAASPESPSSPGQQTIISFLLIGGGLAVMAASAVLFLKQKRD